MNIIQAIIMGVVEGMTEFIPISSTAHLEITQMILGLPQSEFIKSFIIIIQLGAILAVVFLYRKKIFSLPVGRQVLPPYLKNIIIAFIPTGLIGFLLYKIIKSSLLGNIFLAALMLFLGGIVILLFERKYQNKTENALGVKSIEDLSVKQLLILGSAQALAVVPGVSRSGAVIIAGRTLGLSRILITEFSFLLAIPTMLAASSYDLLRSGLSFGRGDWVALSIGFVVSFLVAIVIVKWLIDYVGKHSFEMFGWYRVLLGALLIFYFYIL